MLAPSSTQDFFICYFFFVKAHTNRVKCVIGFMEIENSLMLVDFFQDDLCAFSEQNILLIGDPCVCETSVNIVSARANVVRQSYLESLITPMSADDSTLSESGLASFQSQNISIKKERRSAAAILAKRCRHLDEFYDVRCSGGRVIRVTRTILACFFDLTLEQTASAMMLGCTTIKKLRIWSGLSRWPRTKIVSGRHPMHTVESIQIHRARMMDWAISSDLDMYSCFERACRISTDNDYNRPISPSMLDELETIEVTEQHCYS